VRLLARHFCSAQKNPDSIGDKVTSLILLMFFIFFALRIGNTTSNIEAKSTQTNAVTDDGAGAQWVRLAGRDPPARHMG
jgi:hypothetical protein